MAYFASMIPLEVFHMQAGTINRKIIEDRDKNLVRGCFHDFDQNRRYLIEKLIREDQPCEIELNGISSLFGKEIAKEYNNIIISSYKIKK